MVVTLRVIQGTMAGILQPLSMVTVMRLMPADQRGRASGMLGFAVVLAPVCGADDRRLSGRPFRLAFAVPHEPAALCARRGARDVAAAAGPARCERRELRLAGVSSCCRSFRSRWSPRSPRCGSAARRLPSAWGWSQFAALRLPASSSMPGARGIRSSRSTPSPIRPSRSACRHFRLWFRALWLVLSDPGVPAERSAFFGDKRRRRDCCRRASSCRSPFCIAGRMTDHCPPLHITHGRPRAVRTVGVDVWRARRCVSAIAGVIAGSVLGRVGLGFILPALSVASMIHLTREQMGSRLRHGQLCAADGRRARHRRARRVRGLARGGASRPDGRRLPGPIRKVFYGRGGVSRGAVCRVAHALGAASKSVTSRPSLRIILHLSLRHAL